MFIETLDVFNTALEKVVHFCKGNLFHGGDKNSEALALVLVIGRQVPAFEKEVIAIYRKSFVAAIQKVMAAFQLPPVTDTDVTLIYTPSGIPAIFVCCNFPMENRPACINIAQAVQDILDGKCAPEPAGAVCHLRVDNVVVTTASGGRMVIAREQLTTRTIAVHVTLEQLGLSPLQRVDESEAAKLVGGFLITKPLVFSPSTPPMSAAEIEGAKLDDRIMGLGR